MQVARYWRMKQHLYQLTVNADEVAVLEPTVMKESGKQAPPVAPAMTATHKTDRAKLPTVA